MSIIGKVGHRSLKQRTLHSLIHIVLLIGSVTMLYPFLLMLSSSIKSAVDNNKVTLIPEYLYKDQSLYQKYLESRYNEESNCLAANYAGKFLSFGEVTLPTRPNSAMFNEWKAFMAVHQNDYGVYDYYVSEQYGRGVYPYNQRILRKQLRTESEDDLTVFNNKYSTGVQTWEEIVVEEKDIATRNFMSDSKGYLGRYQQFKQSVPLWHRNYLNLDTHFVQAELYPAFGGDLRKLNDSLKVRIASWNQIRLLRTFADYDGSALYAVAPYWLHYVKEILNVHHIQLLPTAKLPYQQMLKQKYSEIALLNSTWHTSYQSFADIPLPEQIPDAGAMVDDYTFYIENLAQPDELSVRSITNDFAAWLHSKYRSNEESPARSRVKYIWDDQYNNFDEIVLTPNLPADNVFEQNDWLGFVKSDAINQLNILPAAQTEYLAFLKQHYAQADSTLDIAALNKAVTQSYASENDIYPDRKLPANPVERDLWLSFVKQYVSPQFITVDISSETQSNYLRYLKRKYQNIQNLNSQWYLGALQYPTEQIDYFTFLEHKAAIKKEFLIRNYAMVLDQMLNDSKSLKNTLIYCLLSIFLAITVNPLAAYALSRFKPKLTYQIIMLFMLTMAFPAMVMGIPNFLMLKKLNMLNTFWALVLPAAADGYFIFLLKGFFDSLPKELYESARLDGAGEFRLFWQFTLYLSKPILAVIALGAFNAAYRNFLFAFIVCQDQSMWTLMVHIYELMQRASASVGYAALVIAAIPTLAVFVFFQNIIIKGIVVPMEK